MTDTEALLRFSQAEDSNSPIKAVPIGVNRLASQFIFSFAIRDVIPNRGNDSRVSQAVELYDDVNFANDDANCFFKTIILTHKKNKVSTNLGVNSPNFDIDEVEHLGIRAQANVLMLTRRSSFWILSIIPGCVNLDMCCQ